MKFKEMFDESVNIWQMKTNVKAVLDKNNIPTDLEIDFGKIIVSLEDKKLQGKIKDNVLGNEKKFSYEIWRPIKDAIEKELIKQIKKF